MENVISVAVANTSMRLAIGSVGAMLVTKHFFDWEAAGRPKWGHASEADSAMNCAYCGCSRHVDDVGNRVCWCQECDASYDWEISLQRSLSQDM